MSAVRDEMDRMDIMDTMDRVDQAGGEFTGDHNPKPSPGRILPWVLIPLVAFIWFWCWRAGIWTGGDSQQWEREVSQGLWWRRRQMLSFALMQLSFTLGRPCGAWSARYAIGVVSCLAGALGMLALWRLQRGWRRAGWAFAIVASAGFTTIFYGHIETYAQPVAALFLHLLAVRNTARRRWPPWTIAATFCLVMFFHLVIIFALPATLAVLLFELRRRGWNRCDGLWAALAALPGLIFWYAVSSRHWGEGELVGPHFIAQLPDLVRHPWIIFIHPNVPTKFRFLFWDGGFAAVLAFWVFARALWRPRRDPFLFYLALYFICFMGFTAVWNPDAVDRDFDLFCFPWVIAAVGVSRGVWRLPWRAVLVGLILGVNAYLFLTRTVLFADLPARGGGTILLESQIPTESLMIRLDDEQAVFAVNRHIPAGMHQISVKGNHHTSRQIINLHPAETVRLSLDAAGLKVVSIGGGE